MDSASRAKRFRAIWDANTESPKRGTVGLVVEIENDGCLGSYAFMPDGRRRWTPKAGPVLALY
jgi:hypothetical protein